MSETCLVCFESSSMCSDLPGVLRVAFDGLKRPVRSSRRSTTPSSLGAGISVLLLMRPSATCDIPGIGHRYLYGGRRHGIRFVENLLWVWLQSQMCNDLPNQATNPLIPTSHQFSCMDRWLTQRPHVPRSRKDSYSACVFYMAFHHAGFCTLSRPHPPLPSMLSCMLASTSM
jgi:hypothetical protein